jgi:hypothetical protein
MVGLATTGTNGHEPASNGRESSKFEGASELMQPPNLPESLSFPPLSTVAFESRPPRPV